MNEFIATPKFFQWLAYNSSQATLVAVLVLFAQWVFQKRLSPHWRSALWILVIIRLLWPLGIESPISIYNAFPVSYGPTHTLGSPWRNDTLTPAGSPIAPKEAQIEPDLRTIWLTMWCSGVAALLGVIGFNTFTIWRKIRSERPLTNSSILELLEDCKSEIGVRTPITILESRRIDAPTLYGFVRPRFLIPAGLTSAFSRDEIRHIFLHELAHVKRMDIPVNWLATLLLVLHWPNPFVWLTVARMRIDREIACDALALSYTGPKHRKPYGETIIKLLEQFSRPARIPGAVGIIEDKDQIKRRLQMIAQRPNRKTWRLAAAILFVVLCVISFTEAQGPKYDAAPAPAAKDNVPRIVKTTPEVGAKDVDPATKEITITFDRDMARGFSWTGGPPEFPPGRSNEKPTWRDKRTCSLPVTLEAGKYYRVGINSTTHQNFRSADGVPVKPGAIYFTTKGAAGDVLEKTTKPQIVSIVPRNGALDVDPNTAELRVTFNVPMKNGFSWTGGGPSFPPAPAGKKPFWTEDQKTCVLPVELKANSEYRIGLNSPSAKNFQSENGVPLDPVRYTFKTK